MINQKMVYKTASEVRLYCTHSKVVFKVFRMSQNVTSWLASMTCSSNDVAKTICDASMQTYP
jgi:hypothetical protein